MPSRTWFHIPRDEIVTWIKGLMISLIEPKKPAHRLKVTIGCHPKMVSLLLPPGQTNVLDTEELILQFFGRIIQREHTPGSPTSTVTTLAPVVTLTYKEPYFLVCRYNCTACIKSGERRWQQAAAAFACL